MPKVVNSALRPEIGRFLLLLGCNPKRKLVVQRLYCGRQVFCQLSFRTHPVGLRSSTGLAWVCSARVDQETAVNKRYSYRTDQLGRGLQNLTSESKLIRIYWSSTYSLASLATV